MYPVSYDLARVWHADRTRDLRRCARTRRSSVSPSSVSLSRDADPHPAARWFGRRSR